MSTDLLFLKSKSILFAEDDKIVREQMGDILSMVFKEVFIAKDGEEAHVLYEERRPDILLLDIMMPKKDGLKLVKQIRLEDYDTPIVILSSFSNQEYLMKALNLSIDGYLIKPVSLQSILDAMNNAIKRRTDDMRLLNIGKGVYYNANTKEMYKNGIAVSLGEKELKFLTLLIDNHSKVLAKEEIEERLWTEKPPCDTALKCIVSRIRKKLGNDLVVSVRGIGYKIGMDLNILNRQNIIGGNRE